MNSTKKQSIFVKPKKKIYFEQNIGFYISKDWSRQAESKYTIFAVIETFRAYIFGVARCPIFDHFSIFFLINIYASNN